MKLSHALMLAISTFQIGCESVTNTSSDQRSAVPLSAVQRLSEQYLHLSNASHESVGSEWELLRIESEVPGFGGFYRNTSEPELIAYLKDTSQLPNLVSALESRRYNALSSLYQSMGNSMTLKVLQGKFSFSELVAWKTMLAQASGMLFTSIDADESSNMLGVEVRNSEDKDSIEKIAASLDIPHDAITISIAPDLPTNAATLHDKLDSTVGGIMIQAYPGSNCTLGFNLRGDTTYHPTYPNSERYLITAAHCYNSPAGTTGVTGMPIGQPRLGPLASTGDTIATVISNLPWNSTHASCGGYSLCTANDVMIAHYDRGRAAKLELAHNVSSSSPFTINAIQNVAIPSLFTWVGDSIAKIGRTTGRTTGVVSNTCVAQAINHNAPLGVGMHLCVTKASASVDGGDSGGPVIYSSNNPPSMAIPVGISTARTPSGTLIFEGGSYIFSLYIYMLTYY